MGRLYRNDGAFGEVPIGSFDSKYVENTSVSYQNERIFCKHLVNDYKIAECRDGIIYNADGNIAMARLHNGIVYDTDDKEIARYEGNVYGAAAAVVALILKIDAENYNKITSDQSDVDTPSPSDDSSDSSGGSQPSDPPNIFEVIIGLIGAVIIFIVKAVKFVVTSLSKPKAMMAFIIGGWTLDIILMTMYCITEKAGFYDFLSCFISAIIFTIGLFTAIKLNKCKKEQTLKKRTVGLLTVVASPAWLLNFLTSIFFLYSRIAAMLQGVDYYSCEYEYPFIIELFLTLQGIYGVNGRLFSSSISFMNDIPILSSLFFERLHRLNFLSHYISNNMFFALIFSILVLIILASHNRKLKKQQKAQSVNENSTT